MSFLITARNRRDREWDFTIYEDDGVTEVTLSATDDVVRVKIGANDAAQPTPAQTTYGRYWRD